jgi:heat-inducible transcriptional repressor
MTARKDAAQTPAEEPIEHLREHESARNAQPPKAQSPSETDADANPEMNAASQLRLPDEQRLDQRKATILRAVVAEHIGSGQPVGSAHLSSATGLGVSSATIRNEMSVLERDGYLTHPHTSAGRIPTDRGYRFFVDSLESRARLDELKVHQLSQFFDGARIEIEQLLGETTKVLSSLTDYAAVVVAPPAEVATIRSIQIVSLGSTSTRPNISLALVVAVLSNGSIEKHTIEVAAEVAESRLGAASAHLTNQLAGRTLASLARSNGSVVLRTGDALVDALSDQATRSLAPTGAEPESGPVFMGGTSRMIGAFDTVDVVRRVLTVLEQQYVVVNLLREALDRSSSVSIGAEHGNDAAFESLLGCSVVVAPYYVDGSPVGTVGVLGPTRMDYPQAMAAVSAVSEGLTARLSEG